MKKAFKLDEIDCANCARELQDGLAKLDGASRPVSGELHDAEASRSRPTTPSSTEVLQRVVDYTADAEPDCEIIL